MKKILVTMMLVFFVVPTAYAANFTPTLLKLSADPVIQYSFDGSTLNIPVTVRGTNAALIFCVYTKDKAEQIVNIRNGFLGWHHVNKVDTCVYMAPVKGLGIGSHTVTWEGKDNDGGVVPPGEYTYYMWAFDNIGAKTKVLENPELGANFRRQYFQEVDEQGLPLANPIYAKEDLRWRIGNDPMDETLKEKTTITRSTGWVNSWTGIPCFDPKDFNFEYVKSCNVESQLSVVQKWKFVPGGDAELQTDFGEDGYGAPITNDPVEEPGISTDGVYLYTGEQNYRNVNDAMASIQIVDFEGNLIDDIDITDWWSKPDEFAQGLKMNSGPNVVEMRNGKLFLNCHASCIKQMCDPARYMESGDSDDFYVWTNQNGDYVLDNNFAETATVKWGCNYPVVGYAYTIDADDNLFTQVSAYDYGAVSFGLLGPDGYGIGFFSFSGETSGWKKGSMYIDSNTPFDGIYCDNEQAGGTHYQTGGWVANEYTNGLWFVGHDSITGVITSAVAVDEEAPASFSVGQNYPNPFNPTTTISFDLAKAGNVAVEVYNTAGQKVETIADGFMDAGNHSVVWDASDFSAGVYFYTVKSGGFTKTMKMSLLK